MDSSISIGISQGIYAWCGNMYGGSKSGYYLSLIQDSSYPDKKFIVSLCIKMNSELFNKIDTIEMYDSTGFLINYSVDLNQCKDMTYNAKFKIKGSLQNTKLKILFCETIFNPIQQGLLRRSKMKTILETLINIPTIEILGNDKECSICLSEIKNEEIYVTPCKHLFCMKCIFEYLEKNKLLTRYDSCVKYCRHSDKPSNFNCPVCKTNISH